MPKLLLDDANATMMAATAVRATRRGDARGEILQVVAIGRFVTVRTGVGRCR